MDNINREQMDKLIDRMINLEVSTNEIIPIMQSYINNQPVEEKDLIKIYSYLSEIIAKYEIDYSK